MSTIIFPNEVAQNLTTEFNINERGALVQSKGMIAGQELLLEYFFGTECDGSWEPVVWCCGQLKLAAPTNQLLIPAVPGRYRFVAVTVDTTIPGVIPFDPTEWEDVEVQLTKVDVEIDNSAFVRVCC